MFKYSNYIQIYIPFFIFTSLFLHFLSENHFSLCCPFPNLVLLFSNHLLQLQFLPLLPLPPLPLLPLPLHLHLKNILQTKFLLSNLKTKEKRNHLMWPFWCLKIPSAMNSENFKVTRKSVNKSYKLKSKGIRGLFHRKPTS